MNKYFLRDIIPMIEGEYKILNEDDGRFIQKLSPVLEATEHDLSFIAANRSDKVKLLLNSHGKIVVIDDSLVRYTEAINDRTFIVVPDPRMTFVSIANRIFPTTVESSIHPSAVIHSEATIHPEVFIGPHTYIGKATIDKGTVIYGNVHIYDNVHIGKNVKIHAGVVIGADGFGYLKSRDGGLVNFPHIGGVTIEDDVEIGANTCIDRGALGFTTIKRGVKVDNLVHIAHNVVVGSNSMVIANAMIGGSTTIGEDTWVAPSSSLRDAISIGSRVIVGIGAVVTKSIPDNETWTGNPARPLREFSAINQMLKKLANQSTEK